MFRIAVVPARVIRLLALAAWALAIAAGPVHPADAATVTFSPANAHFFGTDTLEVDAAVDAEAIDLRGFSFVFEFNPAIVRPVSASTGALVDGATCPNFFVWLDAAGTGDAVSIDSALLGCSAAGPGAMIRMRFVGVQSGVSPLRCRLGTMRDARNHEIMSGCVETTIEYTGAVPVERPTWGRLKSLYR